MSPKILFYSPYGQWYLHTLYEITLAHALTVRGAEVKMIGCDGVFSDCDVHWENTSPRSNNSCQICKQTQETICNQLAMPVEWLGTRLEQGYEENIQNWVNSVSTENLMSAMYKQAPLGEWVESSVHSHFRMGDLDLSNPRINRAYRSYLFSAAVAWESLTRVFDTYNPDVLFMLNGRFFSHRVAFEIARSRGVRVYNHERGRTDNTLRIFENETALTFDTLLNSWDEWKDQPLSVSELKAVEKVFEERSLGLNTGWKSFVTAEEKSWPELLTQIQLKPKQKLVTLFTSSDDEAGVSKAWKPVIIDQFEWIHRSIEYFKNKTDYKLVIRVHPNISGVTGVNSQFLNRILELLPGLPHNVHVVLPKDNVSTYQLITLSRAVLVYFSSLGLEAPFMGKPVMICSKGLFYDKNLGISLWNEEEYEAKLSELLKATFGKEQLQAAYRYGYHYFIRQNLPFPKVSVINVHHGKVNYQSEEDLQPGKDVHLDRLCDSILSGSTVIAPPKKKRSPQKEMAYLNKRLKVLDGRAKKIAQLVKEQSGKVKLKKDIAPLISVIIPCYNYAQYLPEAVESVVRQSLQDFEIIIVNDGSTDNSKQVAEQLVAQYPTHQIRLLDQPNSGQPAIARNNGIKIARGKYILPLDADDKLHPQALENLYGKLKDSGDNPVVAYGHLQFFGTDTNLWVAVEFNPHNLLRRNQLPVCSLFHRSVWELQDGYRTNVPGFEDWDFWIGAARIGAKFIPVPHIIAYYRKTDNVSMIDKAMMKHEWYIAKIILNNAEIYEQCELNWANDFLQRNPEIPEKREFHGPHDRFPHVGALLVSSHSERYSDEEVRWASEYLKRNPFTVQKKIMNRSEMGMSQKNFSVTAIIAAFNEGDVIFHVIGDLVKQGIKVYFIDHNSTDNTVSEAAKWLGKGLIKIEKFPGESGYPVPDNTYSWRYILKRKEDIVRKLGAGWYIHADADEFREAPWFNKTLYEGIQQVDKEGFNAINFRIYDFKPTDNRFVAGEDVRDYLTYYSDPKLEYDQVQVKCWKYNGYDFNLWESGGHEVRFENRKIYPVPFILRHYPIRSQEHGVKKVFNERKPRWDAEERAALWHDQYTHIDSTEHQFIESKNKLLRYDRKKVCAQLMNAAAGQENRPLVSIIMLTFNALEYTKKCIQSIRQHTRYPHEIIIIDNGSKDGTRQYLRELDTQFENIHIKLNKKNKGFSGGNNQGARLAKGKYVYFLNNDVLVADGWLESMVKALEADDKIGMVGPLTNSISGLQMVTNINYTDDPGFYEYAAAIRKEYAGKLTPRRRIAGFAFIMKKELYTEIGGFDDSYGTGNFEDDDLCLRVRQKGYAIMVDESTFIHHYGSQTFKANKIDILKSLEEKGQIFKEKWPEVDYNELLEIKNPLSKRHVQKVKEAAGEIQAGKYETAREIFTAVLAEHPLHSEALLGMANCLIGLKSFNQAQYYLNKLLKREPNNAQALNQAGLAFMGAGELESAKSCFILAVEKEPQLVDAQRNLGDCLIELEEYETGINVFQTILKNHPGDIPSLLYMSEISLETGRLQEAQQYINRVLQLDDQNELARQLKELIETGAGVQEKEDLGALQKAKISGNIVCIAGMHRSGTSLLTQLLHANGVNLGDEKQLMKATEDNEQGYWENTELVKINEAVLSHFAMGWDHIQPLPKNWQNHKKLTRLKTLGAQFLEVYTDDSGFVWKDPRNSITFPFWKDIAPELKAIVVFRNPLEVAHSLVRRNRMSIPHSLYLWQIYHTKIMEETSPDERLFVAYERLLSDPESELTRVLEWLGRTVDPKQLRQSVSLVKKELQHHSVNDWRKYRNENTEPIFRLYEKIKALSDPGLLKKEISKNRQLAEIPHGLTEAQDLFLAGQVNEALTTYLSVLQSQPESGGALLGAAMCCNQLKKYEQASVYLNRLLQIEPENAQAYNQSGLAFAGMKDFQSALSVFEVALQKDPGLIDAQRNYGDTLIELGDYENGVRTFQAILEKHPDDVPSLLYMTDLNVEAGRLEDAKIYCTLALKTEPQNELALQYNALLQNAHADSTATQQKIEQANHLLEKGESKEAETIYQTVLNETPSDLSALFGMATVCQLREEYDKSREWLQKALSFHSDIPEIFNMLGSLELIQGNGAQAANYFKQSLEIEPAQAETRNRLADALLMDEQYEQGIELLLNTQKEFPGDSATLLHLGSVYLEAGREEEAESLFRKVLDLDPENRPVLDYFENKA